MSIVSDSNYGEMSASAQRRPASPIGSPSLTWYRAFWKPLNLSGKTWRERIDRVLFRLYMFARYSRDFREPLYRKRRKRDQFPNFDMRTGVVERELHLFNTRYVVRDAPETARGFEIAGISRDSRYIDRVKRKDRVTFSIDVYGCRVTVRAELHHEYWSMTVFADFSDYKFRAGDAPPVAGADDNASVRSIKQYIDELRDIAVERSKLPAGNRNRRHTKRLVEQKSELISEAKALIDRLVLADTLRYASTGGVFSDSFGIIIALKFVQPDAWHLMEPPRDGKSVLEKVAPLDSFRGKRVHYLVDAVWPLVRYAQFAPETEDYYGKPEYTLSLLQRRRLLYVSALGRITPAYDDGDAQASDITVNVDPTIYFMFPAYRSRWQLGRAVEQMHNLATWRAASVRSIYGLALSSRQIGQINRDISKGVYRDKQRESELKKRFDEIGTEVKTDTSQRINYIDGEIQYRVGRARYYYENFRGEIDRLAIDRVEGFPPYDEFVGRRLNETHQFIQTVGDLYTELSDRIRLELNYYRYKQSEIMQKRIDDNTKLAVHFLENAEKVLFIPLTYYTGSTLHYFHEFILYVGEIWDNLKVPSLLFSDGTLHRELSFPDRVTLTLGELLKGEFWSGQLAHFVSSGAMLLGFAWAWFILRDLKASNDRLEGELEKELNRPGGDVDVP